MLKIYLRCEKCDGDGIAYEYTYDADGNQVGDPEVIDPCPECDGEGFIEDGCIEGKDTLEDILDKVNDIKEKIDEMLE